jgi:polar amino acid transport system substrate-binding protein
MAAALQLMATKALDMDPLISHRIPIAEAPRAYELITGRSEPSLGVVLQYDIHRELTARIDVRPAPAVRTKSASGRIRVGVIGAGNFAKAVAIPNLAKRPDIELRGIVSAAGASARQTADRFGFAYCASSVDQVIADPDIDAIAIFTRHDLHAAQAAAALDAGKHVFLEKPLAITHEGLKLVTRAAQRAAARGIHLAVGFNRRFAPMALETAAFLSDRHGPLVLQYRANAGALPRDHWTRDPVVGGGRIIGEGCHFVDLLTFLAGAPPVRVQATGDLARDDVLVMLDFADGSVGTVVYAAGGDRALGKERLEVLGAGRASVLDDFRELTLVRDGSSKHRRDRFGQDKGHKAQWDAFAGAIRGEPSRLTLREMVATTLATFAAMESLAGGVAVPVDVDAFLHGLSAEP